MNQRNYIVYAVLLLVVIAGAYLVVQKFSGTKIVEDNSTKVIDYDEPVDAVSQSKAVGKSLFNSRCASCHHYFKDATGPALYGITERGPWSDSIKLYKYIRYPNSLGLSNYIDSLRKVYGSNHIGFPDLSDIQIKSILEFINSSNLSVSSIVVCE